MADVKGKLVTAATGAGIGTVFGLIAGWGLNNADPMEKNKNMKWFLLGGAVAGIGVALYLDRQPKK